MAAILSSELGNTDKIYALTQECSRMGIEVLKPNVQTSNKKFEVNIESKIEYGLGAIKGLLMHLLIIFVRREKTHLKTCGIFPKN